MSTLVVNAITNLAGQSRFGPVKGAVQVLSGTLLDFTNIPSWVTRIQIPIWALSTNGTSNIIVQLGSASGIETTGYSGSTTLLVAGVSSSNWTSGMLFSGSVVAANTIHGLITITLVDATSNVWNMTFTSALSNTGTTSLGTGTKALAATLDRVRLTMANGTDTFDAGAAAIIWE